MSNLAIKINLTRLPGVIFTKLTGKSGLQKDCIVIPVEDCHLFVGEKGVYLDLSAYEFKEQKYSDSHMVKQSFSKEAIEEIKSIALTINPNLTESELQDVVNKANPIIGGIKPFQRTEMQPTQTDFTPPAGDGSDLPF
jgi:hypothetical protein